MNKFFIVPQPLLHLVFHGVIALKAFFVSRVVFVTVLVNGD